jgi:ESAT-6 family protein
VTDQTMVTTDAMRQAATTFQQAEQDCFAQLTSMDNSMQSLTAGWAGVAQQKFNQVLAQWTTDFNTVVQQLQVITETLQGGAVNYDTIEGENAQLVSSLSQQMQGLGVPAGSI